MIRAVVDANVLVSAAIHPEGPPGRLIERYLREGAFDLVVTPAIGDEIRRALAYPKVRKYLRKGLDAGLWFEDLVLLAHLVPGTLTRPGVCSDADDDKYVAAAVEGRAGFVVAGDAALLAVGSYERILIVTPRRFLTLIESASASRRG